MVDIYYTSEAIVATVVASGAIAVAAVAEAPSPSMSRIPAPSRPWGHDHHRTTGRSTQYLMRAALVAWRLPCSSVFHVDPHQLLALLRPDADSLPTRTQQLHGWGVFTSWQCAVGGHDSSSARDLILALPSSA